jgi:hypothetical protein
MIISLLTSTYLLYYLYSRIKPYGFEIVGPSLLCWGRRYSSPNVGATPVPYIRLGSYCSNSIPTSESATIIGAVAKRIQVSVD